VKTRRPDYVDHLDQAGLAAGKIAARTVVLYRLCTLMEKSAATPAGDFGSLHAARFWQGLADIMHEATIEAEQIETNVMAALKEIGI
jgi:hypothetical protein